MVDDCAGADLVHSHTWYANMAGHLAGLMHDIPHVVSAHSLEPMRPWKAEQLGGGYAVSSWVERTAYEGAAGIVAVSAAMRDDVLRSYPAVDPARVHVVHNGIDTELWSPVSDPDRVRALGLDPDRRSVIFVGRITRQKGLPLFLRAVAELPPDVQLILCAGAPDTPEIAAEVRALVDGLAASRHGVVWIEEMLPRADVVALLTRRHGLRLPVDLRAARHRQPRGDGVRDRRRRHRDRRHPRGRRRRLHRLAGAHRAGRPTAPGPRSTPSATSPTSPPRSPTRCATPTAPAPSASPDGCARRSPSAGTRSPDDPRALPLARLTGPQYTRTLLTTE